MKRFIGALAVFLLLASTTFAQFTVNALTRNFEGGKEVKFTFALGAADAANDSLLSSAFSLEDADAEQYFAIYYNINGASTTTDSIVAQLYASEDNVTFTSLGGTSCTAGALLLDTITTMDPTWTYSNFGEIRARYYKLGIECLGTVAATSSTIIIRSRRKDFED